MSTETKQPKQWVVDLTSILESVASGVGVVLSGGKTPTPTGGPNDQVGPAPDPTNPFQLKCPDGYKFKDEICQKKGFPIVWVGVGLAVIAGTYFLVTKFKNK